MAFVDLPKAFDKVNRDLPWSNRHKFGCPFTFVTMLQRFHIGMCAQVVIAGSQSSCSPADVGVKQGCILAPINFNLLLVAMAHMSRNHVQPSDIDVAWYRLDGGLIDLHHLNAKSKTSSALISALWYADDAAFTSLIAA